MQFYCGWGDASRCAEWCTVARTAGWDTARLVIGVLTNPDNGSGWVNEVVVARAVVEAARGGMLGGVMGWEYFNALPGGEAEPWRWAEVLGSELRRGWPPLLPPRMDVSGAPSRSEYAGENNTIGNMNAPAQLLRPEDIDMLQELGFSRQEAITALNMAEGMVEVAAELLLRD